MPPKLPHRNSKKRLRKSSKRKNGRNTNKPWGTTLNHLYKPWKVHTRTSFRPIILPSHKISPWSSQASPMEILMKIGRENRKTKWGRVPRDGCHPLTTLVIWRQSRKTKIPLKPKLGYTPTKGTLENCLCSTIRRMPGDRTLRSLDASLAILTRVLRLEASGTLRPQTGKIGSPNQSGLFCPDSHAWSSALALWLNRVTRWFSGEPPQTPRTWCSLRQSPLMTWLPWSPDLTLVLWLNQETVLDFILLYLPPCSPHLTPLATGSFEPSLFVFSTPGGLTRNDLLHLFFTRTNTSQAATCTCNI
jgi:hypothetical protein